MKKLLVIGLIMAMVLSLSFCYAGGINLDDFSGSDISDLDTAGNAIVGVMQVVATVVAIAMLLFVGIKFMMAAPAEKANLKGALIPYIVGAILIFAAIPLLKMVQSFASNFS